MSEFIECENISKKIGDFQLEQIGFQLPKGYLLGVVGRNGCGKSTLLRCLTGMYEPEKAEDNDGKNGRIAIDGIELAKEKKAFKKQYAYVSGELPVSNFVKAKEFGELYGSYYDGFTMTKYLEKLERFGVPIKKDIGQLSKGQQIKVQLAFALSIDAKVYIFDEPTGNLDVEFREEFYTIVRNLMKEEEKSVIYASHLVEELEEIADYVLWLQKRENVGRVKLFGTLDECRDRYRILEGDEEILQDIDREYIVGGRRRENHGEWLVNVKGLNSKQLSYARCADLKEIMYYEEKGEV